jgi:membrane protein EpsK
MDYIARFAIKLMGLTMALPIGFLVGLANPFLVVWLGAEYGTLTWVFSVMIFHLSVNLLTMPYLNIQVTFNKVRLPALVTFTMGAAYYFLAAFLSRELGPIGIVLAGTLTLTATNFAFMPVYTARIMNMVWWHYLVRLFAILLATLGVSMVSYTAGLIYPITSLLNLFLVGVVISGAYIILAYLIGFTKEDKHMFASLLRKYTHPT